MIAAPIPPNEEARLLALYSYRVLGSAEEPAFDRLVALAAMQFGVPIAAISLTDAKRQWVKAICGMVQSETARDTSFCGHVVADDQMMVVPDARLDGRFHDNPMVLDDPGIRFYAGAPVRTPEGFALGTLCVIDSAPRAPLSDSEQQQLQALADLTADLLEMRKAFLQLSQMAFHDALTGLPNRRLFRDRLHQAIAGARRDRGVVAVALVDLDDFKAINDSRGHEAGDQLLKRLAEALSTALRARDTVARWGGDEFVCCMTLDDEGELAVLLRRLEQALVQAGISGSIGVACFPADGATVATLLQAADTAMYAKKSSRGGRRTA